MNYIEEEFRRQAMAFAALLGEKPQTGQPPENRPERERAEEVGRGGDAVLRASPAAELLARTPAGEMAEWNRLLGRRSAQTRREAAAALGITETELETAAGVQRGFSEGGPGRPGSSEGGSGQRERRSGKAAGAFFRSRREAAAGTGAAGRYRAGGGGESQEAQAAAEGLPGAAVRAGSLSARAMSRAFERDARRYDGGYPLY